MGRIGSAFILTLLSSLATAKVGTIKLDELAKQSEMIAFAEVVSVRQVAGHTVAFARPIRVYKGKSKALIAFIAERTWTCDTSTANKGEFAMLYLSPVPSGARTMGGESYDSTIDIVARSGSALQYLSHSGRGRVVCHPQGATWVAKVKGSDYRELNTNLVLSRKTKVLRAKVRSYVVSLEELVKRSLA